MLAVHYQGRRQEYRKPYRNLLKVGSYPKGRTTYMRSAVRASYSKDEEKKYNDRAIGAGFI